VHFYDVLNDVAFKKVFNNHPELTTNFLNATLRLTEERAIKHVEFLPQEQLPSNVEAKKSILDVKCTDHRGFQYIIEVQNKLMQSYLQRIQYYVAHNYTSQLKTSGKYLELKPVILLSILGQNIFLKEIGYLSYHRNVEETTRQSYLNDMSFAFAELAKFNKQEQELKTPEDWWIYTLKQSNKLQDIPKAAPKEVEEALTILEEHAWSDAEREAYTKARMAKLDDIDAIDTARNEGLQEGRQEGENNKAIAIARNLKKKGLATDLIAEATGLTQKEIESL
jgi:predicted transposase/invertase (TIGR01784 family)